MTGGSVDPLERAAAWVEDARRAGVPEPGAMMLATATTEGTPSVRTVLCRGIDARGFRFFTNYGSRKSRELAENPRAAVVFWWPVLGRQLTAEGDVERLGAAESDAYFAARPRGHQLSAHASPQSQPIASLDDLRQRVTSLDAKLAGRPVPRPENWGGYLLVPRLVELWIQGADRVHDRVRFERRDGVWREQRLAP